MAGTVTSERTVLVILPMGNGMAQAVLTGIRAEAGRRADLVASDCGFASHDDFRRVFRKRCGRSVKAWKAELSTIRHNANR